MYLIKPVAPLLVLGVSAQLALAIGPDYQIVPTATQTGSTVSSVVDFLAAPGAAFDSGTGTIINKYASNGMDYAQILTADHVASIDSYAAYVGIGVNNDTIPTAGNNLFQEQLLGTQPVGGYSPGIGGPNPAANFEDLSIVQITLGAANNAGTMALYNGITPMDVSNPLINQFGATGGTNASFTEYGYGRAGKPIVQGATAGFGAYRRPWNLRFQNNLITYVNTAFTSPFSSDTNSQGAGKAYSEPLVHFSVKAPVAGLIGGASFSGDSGGAYTYLASQQVTVSNYYTGTKISGSIFTDWQFAVHVGGLSSGTNWTLPNYNPPGGSLTSKAKLNGDDAFGVYINQANYTWIESVIPEPSSTALLAVGGSAFLLYRRRRAG